MLLPYAITHNGGFFEKIAQFSIFIVSWLSKICQGIAALSLLSLLYLAMGDAINIKRIKTHDTKILRYGIIIFFVSGGLSVLFEILPILIMPVDLSWFENK